MMRYYGKLALKSIRRNPVLSSIMVLCLAIGIATWVAARAAIIGGTRNPLPKKTGLYLVEIDRPPRFGDVIDLKVEYPQERLPRLLLSAREYQAIAADPGRARLVPSTVAVLALASGSQAAFTEEIRFTSGDLFAAFDLPFVRGEAWDARADREAHEVAVITAAMSDRLFGGIDSVGRSFRLGGRPFTVAGVLADLEGDKTYDAVYPRRDHEQVFVPFATLAALKARPVYVMSDRAEPPSLADFLAGDDVLWIRLWVDVPEGEARAFAARLSASGPSQARLVPFATARRDLVYIHPAYYILNIFAHVILIATVFNLVRLLLAKFTARVDQTGIHRALGASRRDIVAAQLTEAKLIGIGGGILGLVLGAVAVALLNAIVPDRPGDAVIDLKFAIATVVVSILVGGLAGSYPAWRTTKLPPALFLRGQ